MPDPAPAPVVYGKYQLLDLLARGGMAEVFKAKSFGVEGFERLLAIKRILPTMAEDEDFIEMFVDEAKITAQLEHANVCKVFELDKNRLTITEGSWDYYLEKKARG